MRSKPRIDVAWQVAIKLYQDVAGDIVTRGEFSAQVQEHTKGRAEHLARACFWAAFYGVEALDKEYSAVQRRLKK